MNTSTTPENLSLACKSLHLSPMTSEDIKLYLQDNTDLSDEVIRVITPDIYNRLDYQPMYEQIDALTLLLTTD